GEERGWARSGGGGRAAAEGTRGYRAADRRPRSQGAAAGAQRCSSATVHDSTGRRRNHGSLLPCDDRRPHPLQEVEKRRSLCRTNDPTIRLRRGRLDRPNLEMRRQTTAKLPLRGSQCAAHPCSKVVGAQSMGHPACEAKRVAQSQGCRRSKACRHSAPNVDRRDRVQLVDEEGHRVTRNKEITEFPRGREKTSLPGRWRW